METTNTTRPMTAEEYYDKKGFDPEFKQMCVSFAEAYITRLQFEREQQQNSWMPTYNEWKRYPDANCAAMDKNGIVYLYPEHASSLSENLSGDCWMGHKGDWWKLKTIDYTSLDWTKCKAERPEGV